MRARSAPIRCARCPRRSPGAWSGSGTPRHRRPRRACRRADGGARRRSRARQGAKTARRDGAPRGASRPRRARARSRRFAGTGRCAFSATADSAALVKMKYQVASDITSSTTRIAFPTPSVCARKLENPTACTGSMGQPSSLKETGISTHAGTGSAPRFAGTNFQPRTVSRAAVSRRAWPLEDWT